MKEVKRINPQNQEEKFPLFDQTLTPERFEAIKKADFASQYVRQTLLVIADGKPKSLAIKELVWENENGKK